MSPFLIFITVLIYIAIICFVGAVVCFLIWMATDVVPDTFYVDGLVPGIGALFATIVFWIGTILGIILVITCSNIFHPTLWWA